MPDNVFYLLYFPRPAHFCIITVSITKVSWFCCLVFWELNSEIRDYYTVSYTFTNLCPGMLSLP